MPDFRGDPASRVWGRAREGMAECDQSVGSRLFAPGTTRKTLRGIYRGPGDSLGARRPALIFELKNYCKELLLPGERKSIEPMAARLDGENTQSMRQSLHHFGEVIETEPGSVTRAPVSPIRHRYCRCRSRR